jgi:hypothetical protein
MGKLPVDVARNGEYRRGLGRCRVSVGRYTCWLYLLNYYGSRPVRGCEALR